MYAREKLCRDQTHKSSRKADANPPSFSSTLLDEIYRSIDGNVDKSDGSRRACLVEKWMESEANSARKLRSQPQESDVVFFSSTSSSSDSSGALSSSDTEFFGSTGTGRSKPARASCFTAGRPKPVRTCSRSDRAEPDRFGPKGGGGGGGGEDDLIKSKSRALRIYANLKKVKQPISPGGRLTTFINSLFSNAGAKKSRGREKSAAPSTASSYSRSCLSKYSPRSREKMRDGGEKRTVRFEPVDVDLRKSLCSGESGRFGRPPLPPAESRKVEAAAPPRRNDYNGKRGGVFYNVDRDEDFDEEEDCMSDSSSDLFELDHLALFGSDRYCEELPVYETTHFDRNRAIASGLIR